MIGRITDSMAKAELTPDPGLSFDRQYDIVALRAHSIYNVHEIECQNKKKQKHLEICKFKYAQKQRYYRMEKNKHHDESQ